MALAAGVLHALAFAAAPQGPWVGWQVAAALWLPGLLQIVGVMAFLWGLQCASVARQAAVAGALFGTVWVAGSVWWLFISMHRYGGLPAWLAALAVGGLALALSCYLAAASALYWRWRSGLARYDVPLFAALWLLAELARGRLLTGFPWAAAGYAHVDSPLAAWAPWVGVYGMGAVAAAVGALLAAAVAPRRAMPRRLGGLLVAAALAWGGGAVPREHTVSAGALAVSLLQGNVPQDEKFDPSLLPAALDWHVDALLQAKGDLVVAAETAIPLLPAQMPPGLWDGLAQAFEAGPRHALFGVPLGDDARGYTNSAVGYGPGLPLYRYDKHHLVPFGEFIPWGFRWFVDMMNIPLGDFNRGPLVAPSMAVGAQRVAPNICYEDLFGEELAARFRDPAQAPTMLANLSNIGWFGNTSAVAQHLQISRLRTLELQRPMLRATNTGATVVIDHRGVVQASLAPYTQGVLAATVQGRTGLTPYAAWAGRWGLWPLGLLALAVIAGVQLPRLRRRASRPAAR